MARLENIRNEYESKKAEHSVNMSVKGNWAIFQLNHRIDEFYIINWLFDINVSN